MSFHYDPFAQQVRDNPFPYYQRLRDDFPVYYMEEHDAWALSRFDDVWSAMLDWETFSSASGTLPGQVLTKDQPAIPILNYLDPPDHRDLRGAFRSLFSPKRIATLEQDVVAANGRILDDIVEKKGGQFCLIIDYSSRLAADVALTLAGLPMEDSDYLVDCANRFFFHDPEKEGYSEESGKAMAEVVAYCNAAIQARRKNPNDLEDGINCILQYEKSQGKQLSDDDAAANLSMFVFGGADTFPKVFSTTMVNLFKNPEQRAAVAADLDLVPNAVDEALRMAGPTQFMCRTVAKDTVIHDQQLKAGQGLILLLASAGLDSREFDQVEEFKVNRKSKRLLGYGVGQHHCLGVHMAKLELKVSVAEFLRRYPNYAIDLDNAKPLNMEFSRGYIHLPVKV